MERGQLPGAGETHTLLVEHDATDAARIARLLRETDAGAFHVFCVRSLAETVEALGASGWDIVLASPTLPDAPGVDVAGFIHQQAPATPVVLLTRDERGETSLLGDAQDRIPIADVDERALVAAIRHAIAREEREERLRKARTEAERASDSKSRFLAVMSHEIRAPMNTVLGMGELLTADLDLSGLQRERLERLSRAGNHVLRLVDEMLDMSRIEAGRLDLEHISFDLDQLLSRTCEMVQASAAAKSLGLSWTRDDELPKRLVGDPHRVRQILLNLLGNAIKFTHEGSVLIRVQREGKPTDARQPLSFVVTDTGIGIPGAELERIFSRFAQGDASTTRKYGGAGLGLSIARGLAEAMGGSIRVESTLGRGTTFCVSLSLDVDAGERRITGDHAAAPVLPERLARLLAQRTTTVRVLLVDDCDDNHALVGGYLAGIATVVHATSAARAFLELGAGCFDVILMDMHLPLMSGLRATRAIRNAERESGRAPTPIIAVTADALKTSVERAISAGCTAHLAKPLRRDALLQAIGDHVGDEPSASAAATGSADPSVENLVPRFLARRGEDVAIMRAAVDQQDFERVFTIAHNLKGTGTAYGFPSLSELGARLQDATVRRDAAVVRDGIAELARSLEEIDEARAARPASDRPLEIPFSGFFPVVGPLAADDAQSE